MVRNILYYSLAKVKKIVIDGKCIINTKARMTALDDFGWNQEDIKKAFLKLRHNHFYKSDTRYDNSGIYVDYYKAVNLIV